MHSSRNDAYAAGRRTASVPSTPRTRVSAWLSRARQSAWVKPTGRLGLTVAIVAALGWLGARTASSSPTLPLVEADMSIAAAGPIETPVAPQPAATAASEDAGTAKGRGVLEDGRVVLNAASEQELCRLPGVGPSRAKRILALRDKLVRFRSTRQLLRVKGIGRRTLQRMQPLIVLDAPSQDAGP